MAKKSGQNLCLLNKSDSMKTLSGQCIKHESGKYKNRESIAFLPVETPHDASP